METSTELVPVQDFKEIIEAAPVALQINQEKIKKAVAVGEDLLNQIETGGMNDALDEKCNGYLVKCKNTYTDLFDRRKPLTEMFDRIRSVFTDLEAQIDTKKKDNVYGKIQAKRNEYATQKMQEQKKREEEAALKLAREKEVIETKFRIESLVREAFTKQLETSKRNLVNCFEDLTLDDWDAKVKLFREFPLAYRQDQYDSIKIGNLLTAYLIRYISKEDLATMVGNYKTDALANYSIEYKNGMTSLLNELNIKLNSKKEELKAIAVQKLRAEEEARKAAAEKNEKLKAELEEKARLAKEEQERMEREAEERKQQEELKLLEEAEKQRLTKEAESESNKTMELTNTLFENEVTLAEASSENNAIESYEIEVKNSPAWLLIVSFYFEKAGKKEDIETLGKKSLNQMKKFCESHYKKTNEKIDNQYIVYKPVYKVRAAKA